MNDTSVERPLLQRPNNKRLAAYFALLIFYAAVIWGMVEFCPPRYIIFGLSGLNVFTYIVAVTALFFRP